MKPIPKILFHGSNKKIVELIPKKPSQDMPENSMKAIFATSNKRLAMAMGLTSGKNTSSFMGNKKINFVKGKPRMKYVYLHYLPSKTFKLNRAEEFISKVAVKPFKIEKLETIKLGFLWRKSNKKELKEFLINRNKWRKENKDK
jgi:hypothetical protein